MENAFYIHTSLLYNRYRRASNNKSNKFVVNAPARPRTVCMQFFHLSRCHHLLLHDESLYYRNQEATQPESDHCVYLETNGSGHADSGLSTQIHKPQTTQCLKQISFRETHTHKAVKYI